MSAKIKLFILLAFTFFVETSFAQWYDPDKVSKKATAIYEKAYELAREEKFHESIEKINEAIAIYPNYVEAYLSRSGIYAELKNYQASVNDYKKAFAMDSIFSETYYLPYAISLAGIGDFENALRYINLFLADKHLNQQSIKAGNYRKKCFEFALEYKKNHPDQTYQFELVNLGDSINSKSLEYYPSFTIDGKELIFTRRINSQEDFYQSNLIDGKWSKAKPIEGDINTEFNEGAQSISQDGEWLIYTGCNYPEGMGSCDLYMSHKMKNGSWSIPENLGSLINSDQWDSGPSLSPDKKDLYFSSNRFGGYGGKDIWVTHRAAAGYWTRPENLGPTVNTEGNESCPFIHADNQTLYYNSNGLPGYGTTDLYRTKKLDSAEWSEPENLGYPINTIDDEGSLIVAADGKTCYYASDRFNEENGLDIYKFTLRNNIQAQKTDWITGRVFNKKTNEGLPSTIELADVKKQKIISSIQTDENGNYMITIPTGNEYSFSVNRKSYLFYSDNLFLKNEDTITNYSKNIALTPIETGAKIILKNIFFDNNKFELVPTSALELERVYKLLSENPSLSLAILGHTDNSGNKEKNKLLSLNRAQAVVDFLSNKGIDKKRLIAKGMGDTMPIDSNTTEQGKSNNRRTEINIISN